MSTKKYHLLLKKFRMEANITQAQLAIRIGEKQSYISKYESGEQRLDLYEIEKICDGLNISLNDFITEYLN